MPNTGMTELKKKLEEKTDNLINIINNCDTFRESYQSTQLEVRKSMHDVEEELRGKHEELRKLQKGKRLFYLKPTD